MANMSHELKSERRIPWLMIHTGSGNVMRQNRKNTATWFTAANTAAPSKSITGLHAGKGDGCKLQHTRPRRISVATLMKNDYFFPPFRFFEVPPFEVLKAPDAIGPPLSTRTVSSSLPTLSPPNVEAGFCGSFSPSSSSFMNFDCILAFSCCHHSLSDFP